MKILHIINNLDYGGAERLLLQLAAAQQRTGHVVIIVCIAPTGAMADQAVRLKIPVITLNCPAGFSLPVVWRLAGIIRREQADIVHNHNPRGQIFGSLAARLAGVKNITTRHGHERKALAGWLWRLTDKVVFISRATQKAFLTFEPRTRRSEVIHNGIDLSDFPADAPSRMPGCCVGIVARLAPVKDIATLIRAFQILYSRLPAARLVIVGDGEEREKLEEQARGLPVSFLGLRDDIPELLQGFDVFVLSSLSEGVSLTLLEAMAASTPIVATQVGGNPEVIVDGVTGYLVPAREPQALADSIFALLENPALARRIGQAGRKRVEQFFSLQTMGEQYERVYSAVFQKGTVS